MPLPAADAPAAGTTEPSASVRTPAAAGTRAAASSSDAVHAKEPPPPPTRPPPEQPAVAGTPGLSDVSGADRSERSVCTARRSAGVEGAEPEATALPGLPIGGPMLPVGDRCCRAGLWGLRGMHRCSKAWVTSPSSQAFKGNGLPFMGSCRPSADSDSPLSESHRFRSSSLTQSVPSSNSTVLDLSASPTQDGPGDPALVTASYKRRYPQHVPSGERS